MERAPLPDELGDEFTVGDARAAGVSWSRLRSSDLDAPFRGIRIVSSSVEARDPEMSAGGAAASEVRRRALVFALAMPPNQFFTHVTAAVLWGLPVPLSLLRDSSGNLRPLDVGVLAPLRHPRHLGVAGHQLRPGRVHVVEHPELGVRVATPASTWTTLGAVVVDEYDLVAIADAIVRERMFKDDPDPLATLGQLHKGVAAGRRVGAPALRRALPRARTRSASRMETRCRLILVDAGMPEPELNLEICDDRGKVIACVDLAYPDEKVAIEYEGEHHLTDPVQWAIDIARYETLAAMGWFVIRVTKAQVFDERSEFVRRVRRALRARAVY